VKTVPSVTTVLTPHYRLVEEMFHWTISTAKLSMPLHIATNYTGDTMPPIHTQNIWYVTTLVNA
jgi:hypothetical protein